MTDREEREEHIKRLEAALACEEKQFTGKCSKAECDDNCALLYEQGNWGEWKDTLRYAIDSLKTDLKYDLMYEGALEQEPIKEHCKDCKYFEYDSVAKIDGVPLIVAHEICSKWGRGCKTNENGYCFLFESKSEVEE